MNFSKVIRIASVLSPEGLQGNETTIYEEGFHTVDHKLAAILAEKFGFSYQILSPADKAFGSPWPNGSWNGMVGMIERDEADLIIDRLAVTKKRLEVMDYSYPYFIDSMSFATVNPKYSSSFTSFLQPFSLNVWISLMVCIFAVLIIFFKLFRNRNAHQGTITCIFSFHRPQSLQECIFRTTCILMTMIIRFLYTGVLLSFLISPSFSGVQTIKELAKAITDGKYKCVGPPGEYFSSALLNSNDINSKIIGQSLKENAGSTDIDSVINNFEASKTSAYIHAQSLLMQVEYKYFVSNDKLFDILQAIGMKKNFCCKKQLDIFIHRISASGIYFKLLRDSMTISSLKGGIYFSNNDKITERSVSLENFEGVFVLLLLGYVMAIVVLIFELLLGYRSNTVGCK